VASAYRRRTPRNLRPKEGRCCHKALKPEMNNRGITVIDVFRELGIEPTPELTWAVGAAAGRVIPMIAWLMRKRCARRTLAFHHPAPPHQVRTHLRAIVFQWRGLANLTVWRLAQFLSSITTRTIRNGHRIAAAPG
jgi:hypothetical protein